jgi:hypothetical protein
VEMNKVDLKNKKILYLGPVFFTYDQYIIKKLQELGADVTPFELYLTSFEFKLIRKFKKSKVDSYKEAYYNQALKNGDYDYILVRHGYQLNERFYLNLRKVNHNARIINFHWDSIKPAYDYRHLIKHFDKVFSFDYNDCKTYKELTYLPLFFVDSYGNFAKKNNYLSADFKYDLLFIGAWRNTERYNLIKKTQKLATRAALSFYYYLHLSLKDQYVSIKEGINPKESKSKLLSPKQIHNLFSESNCIIDFPSSYPTGLTMRTFETLGAGKKLITTNKNIKKEPFYDEEFINVIDPDNLILDIDFIKSLPNKTIKEKMNNYSIESYIYNLLR